MLTNPEPEIDAPDRCTCGARLSGSTATGPVEKSLGACERCGEATCSMCEGYHAGGECEPHASGEQTTRRAA